MRRIVWCAVLALFLVSLPASVRAQCQAPSLGWSPNSAGGDNPVRVEVPSGINAGQTGQVSRLYAHGNPSNGSYGGNPQWYIEIRRIVDANGQPSNTLYSADFYPSELIQGCEVDPPKAGCPSHGYATQRFGSNGVFDLEAKLASVNPPNGTYEIKIFFWQGVFTFTRTWGIFSNPGVTFFVLDEAGENVTGANLVVHRVDNPGVEIPIGPTTSGQVGSHLAPGDYLGTWSGAGLVDKSVAFGVTTLAPNTYHVTMQRTATTPTGKGDLKVIVLDYTMAEGEPVPLSAATVSVAGRTKLTNGTGEAVFKDMTPGTFTATVQHTGRQTGGVQVRVDDGLTRTYRVTMYTDKQPSISDTTEGEPGFWEKLIVPKKSTLDAWTLLVDRMKNWGPAGVINTFKDNWEHGQISGPQNLNIPLAVQLVQGGDTVSANLDLRPPIPFGGTPYPDGGVGSWAGTMVAHLRMILGYIVYGTWWWRVIHWARPRFAV